MKHSILKRIGALAMTSVMAFSFAVGVSAANEADAIIDTSRKTSLTLFKYDMTSAEEDGAWSTESYVSTGIQDDEVNTTLSPYAVQGVEFTYVRLADVSIFKENIGTDHSSVHATVPLTVTNSKGFDLPKTGGDNSKLPYVAGSLAVLAGLGVAVAALKKKKHA